MYSVLDYNLIEKLLSSNMYIDVDSSLYGLQTDTGSNIYFGKSYYEIKRINNKTINYKENVEILNKDQQVVTYETFDLYLKYYSDGKRRFD